MLITTANEGVSKTMLTRAPPGYPTVWLPTERVARAWQAIVSETPFDP